MELKDEGFISSALTISKILYELLSNNFLKRSANNKIEWLHPLLYDYFLGSEIVNILSEPTYEKELELYNLLNKSITEQSVIIAVGILDRYTASAFLIKTLKINEYFGQNVYLGQEEDNERRERRSNISERISGHLFSARWRVQGYEHNPKRYGEWSMRNNLCRKIRDS